MHITKAISAIINSAIASSFDIKNVESMVDAVRDMQHGDFSSNVAMILGKSLNRSPSDIARTLIDNLPVNDIIESVTIAGPGFINFTIRPAVWANLLNHIKNVGADYGQINIGNGELINIEFASANPTGPLHIGHVRGAIIGDCLAEVMKKTGFRVSKEYYINDAGAQIDTLTRSALLRYREALGENIGPIPEGMYPGEYLVDVGKALKEQYGSSLLDKSDHMEIIKQYSIEAMMSLIKNSMADLRVTHDRFISEAIVSTGDSITKALEELGKRDLLYEDVLERPKGKSAEGWQQRKQLLFRSSRFGDSADRPLTKADGSWTYFAADIAYNFDKIKRGANKLILILGRDHVGYVKRLSHAIDALSDGRAKLVPILYEIVNLLEGDIVVKMSKRSGNFLLADDVIKAVGADAIRVSMLLRTNEMVLDFDLQKASESTKDNPVFYIQYARARGCSVLRRAVDSISDLPDNYDITQLNSVEERTMLLMIASWPDQLAAVALRLEPHRMVFYLQNLAKSFHAFWNIGKDNANFKFVIIEKPGLTAARLALVQAVVYVITSGLQLLKIEPMDAM